MSFINKLMSLLIYLYILSLPFNPEKLKFKGMNVPADILLFLILIIYLLKIIIDKNSRNNFISGVKNFFLDSSSIPMFILVLIMFISVSYSVEKALALNESLRFLTYILLYFIVKYGIDNKSVLDNIIKCYIILLSILGMIGIVQYFTGFDLDMKFISNYTFGAKARIAATFGNPNSYAAFLIIAIFPLILLVFVEVNKRKKLLYGSLSVLILINIVLTGSRNAILAFVIGCVVLSIIYNWRLIYLLIGTGIISIFIPQILNRIKEIADPSQNFTRIRLWKTALIMMKEHPLLGVGNGNFVALYDAYIEKYKELYIYYEYTRYPSHNSYLKVGSELGIFGLVSFISILISVIYKVRKLTILIEDKFYKFFFTGFTASIVAFLFMNIFDNLFFVPKTTVYFWLLFAVADSMLYNIKKRGGNYGSKLYNN